MRCALCKTEIDSDGLGRSYASPLCGRCYGAPVTDEQFDWLVKMLDRRMEAELTQATDQLKDAVESHVETFHEYQGTT